MLPLLDQSRLSGTFGIERLVAPRRVAMLVSNGDISDARTAIEELCLLWGGSSGLLVPHADGSDEITERWAKFLTNGVVDDLCIRGRMTREDATRVVEWNGTWVAEYAGGNPLLAMIHAHDRDRDAWATVDCALPDPGDPWYLAYLGCLGAWPKVPNEEYLRRVEFVPEFDFGMLLNVEHGVVEDPGPRDLIARIRRMNRDFPNRISCEGLALTRAPEASHVHGTQVLPWKHANAAEYGSNLVVVYEAGNCEDLSLLWNLRGGHGLNRGVPLAVPVDEAVAALTAWSDFGADTFALRLFGLVPGRPWGLVSSSVSSTDLDAIAAEAGRNWAAADIDVVLPLGDRAALPSTDVAAFDDGNARVAAFSASDRDLLWREPRGLGTLRVRLRPDDRRLPPSAVLRRYLPTMEGFQGGGMELGASRSEDLANLDWPASWNVLEAVMRDRGFEVRPSRPGGAAMAFLQRIGSLEQLEPLLSGEVLTEVARLGERVGRNYFEGRIRELHADLAAQDATVAERAEFIEQKLDELQMQPFESDQHDLTFDKLKNAVGAQAARAWLGWAEDRGLLIRGAQMSCDRCKATSWRAAGELAPPVICPGCGEQISKPFRPDMLSFKYRASETLLQLVSQSAMPHVLALRWVCTLLARHGLFGAHPGVEILKDGQLIGEVDVLLLFSGGELAIGECKLTPRGLVQSEIDRHEQIADEIGADWTFYAVPEWATDCQGPWPTLQRELPSRPRWALTNEQLLLPNSELVWVAGANPFEWSIADDAFRTASHQKFTDDLPQTVEFLETTSHLDRYIIEGGQAGG